MPQVCPWDSDSDFSLLQKLWHFVSYTLKPYQRYRNLVIYEVLWLSQQSGSFHESSVWNKWNVGKLWVTSCIQSEFPFSRGGEFHSWLQLHTFLCTWANQLQLKLEDCLSPVSGLWKGTWPWGQRRYIARMCGPLLPCPLHYDSRLERGWKIWTAGSVNKYEMKCKTEGDWLLSQGESESPLPAWWGW